MLTTAKKNIFVSLYPIGNIQTLLFSTGQERVKVRTAQSWSLQYVMKHYAIEQWVDYSRGVGEAQPRAQMDAPLAGGCEDCHRLRALSDKLVAICSTVNAIEVPDYAL